MFFVPPKTGSCSKPLEQRFRPAHHKKVNWCYGPIEYLPEHIEKMPELIQIDIIHIEIPKAPKIKLPDLTKDLIIPKSKKTPDGK